jgi:hypothetical protein
LEGILSYVPQDRQPELDAVADGVGVGRGLLRTRQDVKPAQNHAVAPAPVWAVQKRLHVRQPVKGYGSLLEEMP